MTKVECKVKLKQQLAIGRRLKSVGLYEAAAEYRRRAQILLLAYKRSISGMTG
jgi:hypothetical protein